MSGRVPIGWALSSLERSGASRSRRRRIVRCPRAAPTATSPNAHGWKRLWSSISATRRRRRPRAAASGPIPNAAGRNTFSSPRWPQTRVELWALEHSRIGIFISTLRLPIELPPVMLLVPAESYGEFCGTRCRVCAARDFERVLRRPPWNSGRAIWLCRPRPIRTGSGVVPDATNRCTSGDPVPRRAVSAARPSHFPPCHAALHLNRAQNVYFPIAPQPRWYL